MFFLRVHHRAVQHGGGPVHGADVHRLPGRRGYGSGPYPVMTRAEMRAGLDQLPTWALEQKAAANRQVIAITRQRLAAGEQVPRMYQEPGLAWLERQAEVAEALVAERQAAAKRHR